MWAHNIKLKPRIACAPTRHLRPKCESHFDPRSRYVGPLRRLMGAMRLCGKADEYPSGKKCSDI